MIVVVDGNGKPLEWEKVDGMGVHIWMVEDGKEGR